MRKLVLILVLAALGGCARLSASWREILSKAEKSNSTVARSAVSAIRVLIMDFKPPKCLKC